MVKLNKEGKGQKEHEQIDANTHDRFGHASLQLEAHFGEEGSKSICQGHHMRIQADRDRRDLPLTDHHSWHLRRRSPFPSSSRIFSPIPSGIRAADQASFCCISKAVCHS